MAKIFVFFLFVIISTNASAQSLFPYYIDGKFGFVDDNLKLIIRPQFDFAYQFIEGLSAVQKNGRWGFINEKGENITGFRFIDFGETSEGMIPVAVEEGQWGYINLKGQVVLPFIYRRAEMFKFGLAPVYIDDIAIYINKQGEQALDDFFIIASEFNDYGFTQVIKSWDYAYIIDTLGQKHPYLGSSSYSLPYENVYLMKSKGDYGNYGFHDLESKEIIIPYEYDLAYHFANGLAPVKKNSKWGFINTNNEIVIDFIFDDASSFSEGLAAVKVGDKKGYIDTTGNFVIQPQFDTAIDFHHGVGEVSLGEIDFFVNNKGQVLKN